MSATGTPTAAPSAPAVATARRSTRADLWRRFRRDKPAVVAGGFLILLVAAATLGAPLAASITGHGPDEQFRNGIDAYGVPLAPLSHELTSDGLHQNRRGTYFVLGTDRLGRDALVRLAYGARVSLEVAFGATSLALLLGVTLGMFAGYFGGLLDAVISRCIETAMAFPALLFAIGLAVVIGPGLLNVILVIAIFSWYYPARMVRGLVLGLREVQFVEAAHSLGASDSRILFRHILPHLAAPITVYGTTIVAANILFEAGLSYLGLGVPSPTASWGQMLADGVNNAFYQAQPWLALIPGAALAMTMLAFNLLGDGLRDAFDPRSSL